MTLSLSTYLQKRANARNMDRLLFTEDWLTVSASVGLGITSRHDYEQQEEYQEWREHFSHSFHKKMDEFTGMRLEKLDEYKELLAEKDITSHEALKTNEEVLKFAKSIYNHDIDTRWSFEQLFAETGGAGAKRVLGYYDYHNGDSSYHSYSREQFEQLLETGKVMVEGSALQGHHINNFSNNSTILEKIETLFHPNNIRLMTGEAHRKDPEYGHGGSWQNDTSGEANEVGSKFQKIVEENEEITEEIIASLHLQTGVGMGLLFGTMTSILEMRKLKADPRPWKKKALLISVASLVKGVEAGTLSLLALKTRYAISSLGDSEQYITRVDDANHLIAGLFPGVDTLSLEANTIAQFVGFSASIAEIRIIRSGIVALIQWKHSDFKTARNQFGRESLGIITEESLFFVTAIGTEALIRSLALEAGQDALIPDPTGGFIIVTRLSWSIFKKSYQFYNDQKTVEAVKQKRIDGLYETAISSLTYFG